MEHPPSLLVRLPNPVGDVVMATPLLRQLRLGLPQTRILVAGKTLFADLLDGLDSFDQFVPLEGGVRSQARVLRRAAPDVALLLPNSWSSALAARLAGIPARIGRRAQGRGALLTTRLPAVGPARPMTRIYLEMLAALHLPVPPTGQEPAAELPLASPPAVTHLGVAPGAAFGPSKQYPLDQLVAAAAQLQGQHALPLRLIGSPGETDLLTQTAAALREAGLEVELPEPAGLGAAKQRIAGCAVLLTMDSGARHIATALGVPQVVLYGPTHPEWSAHGLESTTILRRAELDCLNCHEKVCPIDHRCMTRIEPEQVAGAVSEALKQSERTPKIGARS